MSNDKKNEPQSTITKLIDYFNKDEEKEEENINNQKSEMKSYDISEKFYRLYSMRDENEVEQNNNQINSNTKDNINKEINNNNNINDDINKINNNNDNNNQNNNQL